MFWVPAGSRSLYTLFMTANKNPRVFSPGVLLNSECSFSYTLSPRDPWLPGILFTVAKPRDQACVWLHIASFNSVWDTVFIISPIVLYLPFEINLDLFWSVVFIQHIKLVAGDGIAPPVFRLWAWWDTTSPPRVIGYSLFIVRQNFCLSNHFGQTDWLLPWV